MNIRFVKNARGKQADSPYPNDVMCIDDARILYPNFSGMADKANNSGKRVFQLMITDADVCTTVLDNFDSPVPAWKKMTSMEIAEYLKETYGYNVSIKEPNNPGEAPYIKLKVKVAYSANSRPEILMDVNGTRTPLNEDTVGNLDRADIIACDMDIRPFWCVLPKFNFEGIQALVNGLVAYIRPSRFTNFEAGPILEDKNEEMPI